MRRFQRPILARLVLLWSLLALAACASLVPASAPPHIKNTPGASVIVTDNTFDAGLFRLEYPRTWSIVKTSEAASPHLVIYFLAPAGGHVFLQQVEPADYSADEHMALPNGVILKLQVAAADPPSAAFAAQARRLIASIRS